MEKNDKTIVNITGQLELDTSKTGKKIDDVNAKLDSISKHTVTLNLSTDSARGKLKTVQNNLNKIFDKEYKLKVDTSGALDALKTIAGNSATIRLRTSIDVGAITKVLEDINKVNKTVLNVPTSVDKEYESLLEKRNKALAKADKAWQESKSKNTPNYNKAMNEFIKANKEYTEFAQKTGKVGLSSLIKQYENMLGSNLGKDNPVRKEIERLWKEAIKRQDELAKELAAKNPIKQAKLAEALAMHEEKLQQLRAKADAKSAKESEKARDAVIKEGYASDKHQTDLLTMQAKARAKAEKEALDALKAYVKEKEKLASISLRDVKSGLTAKNSAIDLNNAFKNNASKEEIDRLTKKFWTDMENFKNSRGLMSASSEANLFKNVARNLKDAQPVLDQMIKRIQDLQKEADNIKIKINPSVGGGSTGGAGNNKISSALRAEINKYAAQAEEIWMKMQTVPKVSPQYNALANQLEGVKSSFRDATQDLIKFQRELGGMSPGQAAKTLATIASSLEKTHPLYNQLISDIQRLNKEQNDINKLTGGSNKGVSALKAKINEQAAKAEDAFIRMKKFPEGSIQRGVAEQEFKNAKKAFSDATQELIRFQRELGGMSPGQAAKTLSTLAASLGRNHSLYKQLIADAKKLNEEQAKINKDVASDKGVGRWFGSVATQITHFVGRSSKGWGSFGEAVADAAASMQAAGGAIGTLGASISGASAIIAVFSAGIAVVAKGLSWLGNTLYQIGTTIYQVLRPGIELYKQQTSAIFSFTAALKSNAKYFEGGSSSQLSKDQAKGLSKDLIARATLDAEMSAFSLDELLRSLQGTLPILLAKGMSLDQAYEVNKGVAGVAKMIQLTPSQILQETRDLAQGSITSRGSQIANALGITNADISKYKGNADELFNFLMSKFKEYSELLQEFEDTALGRWQQLQERWQTVTKTITEWIADQFKGVFEYLIEATGSWVDKEGNKLNAITGKWEDSEGNVFDKDKGQFINQWGQVVEKSEEYLANVGKAYHFELSEPLKELIPIFQDIILYAASLIDDFKDFVKETIGAEEPLKKVKNIVKGIMAFFFKLLKIAIRSIDVFDTVFALVYNFTLVIDRGFKVITLSLADLAANLLKVANMFGPMLAGAGVLMANPLVAGAGVAVTAVTEIYKDEIDSFIAETHAEQEKLSREKPNFISGISDLTNSEGKKGDLYNKLVDSMGSEEKKRGDEDKKNQHLDASKTKGTYSSQEDEKARKKAIQDAQKAMKARIQELKDALKDFISDLKDTLEKNKIAYEEGFMSMREYFTQKAELERQEAEAKLLEAQAELNEVLKTPYNNQDDQRKEVSKLNREIKQYTRELNKTLTAQKEVANVFKEGVDALSSMAQGTIDLLRSGPQEVVGKNIAYNAENTAGMSNAEIVYRILTSAAGGMNDAMARGIIASMMGESGTELNPNLYGDYVSGRPTSYGVAQWHNERWQGLKDFGAANNSDYTNIVTQIYYLLYELTHNESSQWQKFLAYFKANGGTPEAAARGWTIHMERPANRYARANERVGNLGVVNRALDSAKNNRKAVSYSAPVQYMKYGIDTRYTDIEHTLRPNEIASDLGNLQQYVKDLHNIVAKEYFEATGGKKLDINIATAGNHPSNVSPWGHKYGYKIDYNHAGVDFDILGRIFNKYGIAGVLEGGNHIDASYGPGGVGRGRLFTNSRTGQVAYDRYRNGVSGISASYAYKQNAANTTEFGHEAAQAKKNAIATLRDLLSSTESWMFNKVENQIKALYAQMEEDLASQKVNMLEGKDRDAMKQLIKINTEKKVSDIIISVAKKTADYNINKIQADFNRHSLALASGKMDYGQFSNYTKKYIDFWYNFTGTQSDNIWSVFKYIDTLTKEAKKLLKFNDLSGYQEAMKIVRDYYKTLDDLLKKPIDKIQSSFDHIKDLFTTSDKFTTLQKEFGNREVEATQAQALYNVYSSNYDYLSGVRDLKYKEYQSLVPNSEEAKVALQELTELDERLWDTKKMKEKMGLLKDQYPEYLRDLRLAAKQSLEDGLLNFLTNDVNEAKSLGEAFRNLATTILKEMQKVSAKYMVKNLMNKWFGGYNVSDYDSLRVKTNNISIQLSQAGLEMVAAIRSVTAGILGISPSYGISGISQQQSLIVPKSTAYTQQQGSFYVPSLESRWQNNGYELSALRNSQFGSDKTYDTRLKGNEYSFDNISLGFDRLNNSTSGLNTAISKSSEQILPNFNTNLSKVAEDAGNSKLNEAGTAATNFASQINSAANTAQTSINAGLVGALEGLEVAARNAATMLNTIGSAGGHADGGYISGPGTSTSDSIPAMLSDGEYVIKASSVRKYGTNFLNSVNNGHFTKIKSGVQHFAEGGLVENVARSEINAGMQGFANQQQQAPINNNAHINIALVRDEAEGFRQLLKSPEGQRIMLDFSRKYASITSRF